MTTTLVGGYEIEGIPGLLVALAILYVLYGLPVSRLAARTGNSRWLGAVMAVPLLNILVLWALATTKWQVTVDANTKVVEK